MKKYLQEFKDWISESYEHNKMAQLWFKQYRLERSIEFLEQYDSERSWHKIKSAIYNKKCNTRLLYISVSVAASFLLILTLVFFQTEKVEPQESLIVGSVLETFPEKGGKKAVLTLHTGERIDLTTQKEQIVTNENDSLLLVNSAESLIYKESSSKEEDAKKYNTLTIPRGGEYQVVLSDGTKIWLNAESSLHYPIAFSQTREVTLRGEAYFEVTKSNTPFVIHTGTDQRVEVLGTKLNVSAYKEDDFCTTLAEGKVKIYNAESSVTLSPNQQAIVDRTGKIKVEQVDATLYTSWSQGVYQFKRTELEDIIAQISRWYDVSIFFKEEKLKHKLFTGVIYRNNELGFAVESIEAISNIKFISENNAIYIMNKDKK